MKTSELDQFINELDEQINLTRSIIQTVYREISRHIDDPDNRQFLGMLPKQMEIVEALYYFLYRPEKCQNKKMNLIGYSNVSPQILRNEWMESAYILNSMGNLIYDVLDDTVQDHHLNNLALVKKCTKQIVPLIEHINYASQLEESNSSSSL